MVPPHKKVSEPTAPPRIKIDKDIPMPNKRGKRLKYPWYDMKVGDSFLSGLMNHSGLIHPPLTLINKGWEFTQMKIGIEVRVWRIK